VLTLALLCGLAWPACSETASPTVSWDPAQVEQSLPEVVAALRANQPQRALDLLDRLAAAKALPEGAGHLRALALQDLNRTQDAEKEWLAELALHPGNGRAHALMAQLLIDQGRLEEAGRHLEDARRFAPGFSFIELLTGRLALQQDDDERAQRAFRDYLILEPYGSSAAEAHHALALIYSRRGPGGADQGAAHERASQALEQVYAYLASYESRLAQDPEDIEAADGAARAYLSLYQNFGGDRRLLDKAEPALLYVLERKPDHATALYNLGFVRAEQKRLPEALELFRRSVEADPEAAPARINLGRTLLALGRNEEAARELDRALQVAASDEERARARLELGHVFEAGSRPEDWAVAIEHYRAVLALDPEDTLQLGAQIQRLEGQIAAAQLQAQAGSEPAPR
jgi:tetratricopeptide (TPR) repeat protein